MTTIVLVYLIKLVFLVFLTWEQNKFTNELMA